MDGGCELSAAFKPLECIFFTWSCGHISDEKTEKEGARLKIDKLSVESLGAYKPNKVKKNIKQKFC